MDSTLRSSSRPGCRVWIRSGPRWATSPVRASRPSPLCGPPGPEASIFLWVHTAVHPPSVLPRALRRALGVMYASVSPPELRHER